MARLYAFIILLCLALPVLAENEVVCDIVQSETPEIVYDFDADGWEQMEAIFTPQILAYLNAGATLNGLAPALETAAEYPQTFAQTIQADFTADNQTDVLVVLSFSWGQGYEAYLMLFSCGENAYFHRTSASFGGWDAGEPVEVLYTLDLNNNQFRDILLTIKSIEGQKYHETLLIFEWDGDSLEEIFRLGPEYGGYSVQLGVDEASPATPYIGVGDSYAYEEETAMAFIEFNYIRPTRLLYQWNGEDYAYLCRHFTDNPQLYPTALHSAESYRSCGNFESASLYYRLIHGGSLNFEDERWYTDALIVYPEDISEEERSIYPHELERAYYRAFASYRLLQLAIHDGNLTEAEHQVSWLEDTYSAGEHGYVYAAMAFALWEDYQSNVDLSLACEAAARAFQASYADGDEPGILYNDDPSGYHYGFYFGNGRRYAADPDNLFAVPDSIDGMVSTPICL